MTTKHTPGPWRAGKIHTVHKNGIHVADVDSKELLACDEVRGNNEAECLANARLIAASPELLSALERCLPWIGKMIADKAHLNSVAPNDCVGAMVQWSKLKLPLVPPKENPANENLLL